MGLGGDIRLGGEAEALLLTDDPAPCSSSWEEQRGLKTGLLVLCPAASDESRYDSDEGPLSSCTGLLLTHVRY